MDIETRKKLSQSQSMRSRAGPDSVMVWHIPMPFSETMSTPRQVWMTEEKVIFLLCFPSQKSAFGQPASG